MTQPARAKKTKYTGVIGMLLAVVVLLILFVHGTHAVYEGRVFYDHDLHFLGPFHYLYNVPPLSFERLVDGLFPNNPGGFYYPLVNALLGLTALVVPVNLLVYRCFNLIFLALLMGAAYRMGSLLADRRAGLLCAVTIAVLPVIDDASRSFNSHFHAAALILLAHAYLIRLFHKPQSFAPYPLIGVLCGLAVLAHPISLLQSALPLGFLLIWTLTRKDMTRKALRLGAALVGFVIVAYSFLLALPQYVSDKAYFLFEPANDPHLLAAVINDWLTDISFGFFGPWYLLLFAGLLAVSVYHFVATDDRRFDDLFLAVALLFNALLSLLIRLSGGFTNDILLFACLTAVLLPAIAWREFSRLPNWRPIIPLIILAVFLAAVVQKSAALSAYPSSNSEEFRSTLPPMRSHLVIEPDWLRQMMREMERPPLPKKIILQTATREGQTDQESENESAKQRINPLVQAAKLFNVRPAAPQPGEIRGRANLALHTKNTPWTAREAAHWLRERLGHDPAGYAGASWFVKNGDLVTFGLDQPHVLVLIRRAP